VGPTSTHEHDHDDTPGRAPGGGHSHSHAGDVARRTLIVVLAANAIYLVVEVIGGFAFDSLALLADAAHMSTDVAGLVIALVAQILITRPASARRTFGLRRAEALGALANAALILAAVVWIVVEAIGRLEEPADVGGVGLLVVAAVGLGVNLVSAFALNRVPGHSLNVRAAFLYMAADAAGSLAAVIAGIGVIAFDADWLDPVASLVIAVLVLASTWGLLRDTMNVLLEGVPRWLDVDDVESAIAGESDVEAVHHLHVWEVSSDMAALSAHVVLADTETLHDAQHRGEEIKAMLAERFGIEHATLELECHECATPDHHHT
jgi:cobalt-zinc-cadmium efflux system protein